MPPLGPGQDFRNKGDKPMYDVAVVGAGPGGSMAAKKCAHQGLTTELNVQLSSFTIQMLSPCGGSLTGMCLGCSMTRKR